METTLHVSANGNVAETRKILNIRLLHVSVVSVLRKHDGNFNLQISVTFPNYGNTLFRPVNIKDSLRHDLLVMKKLFPPEIPRN